MADPTTTEDCGKFLPDQSKWTHAEKVKKAAEAKKQISSRNPKDYEAFFAATVGPLNQLAKDLQLRDVEFVLALSSHESSWLDVENAWLNNPFGLTAGGHDNLGFDSIQQAVNYWKCKYGRFVKATKTMADFVAGLKKAKYNPNDAYYALDKWNAQIQAVKNRYPKFGYEKTEVNGTYVLLAKGNSATIKP